MARIARCLSSPSSSLVLFSGAANIRSLGEEFKKFKSAIEVSFVNHAGVL